MTVTSSEATTVRMSKKPYRALMLQRMLAASSAAGW